MKKYLKIIRVVISLALLGFLFLKIDPTLLFKQFSHIHTSFIILAFFVLGIQTALSTLKWKIILRAEDKFIPFFYLLKCYLIGNFISLFLPSSFGGDVYRVYALGRYNKDYLQNTSSVLFDRLTGLFALTSLAVVSFALFSKKFLGLPFIGFYAAGILFFWITSSQKTIAFLGSLGNKFTNPLVRVMGSFSRYRRDTKILILSLIISFLFQSNIVVLNKVYCHALNIDVDLTFLFMVIPLIYLTETLPISINGLGVREGAFVFFFTQEGQAKEKALALGLLLISIRYLFSILVGGSLFLRECTKSKASEESKTPGRMGISASR
jgi:glycosyltransferase 2 family protein